MAAILKLYGHHVTFLELKSRLPQAENGTSVADMMDLAKEYNMHPLLVQLPATRLSLLSQEYFPLIVHLDSPLHRTDRHRDAHHFSVVVRHDNEHGQYRVLDINLGMQWVEQKVIESKATGNVLFLFQEEKKVSSLMTTLESHRRGLRSARILLIIAGAGIVAVVWLRPWRRITERLQSKKQGDSGL